MAIIEWWNSLSLAAQFFYCIAIPSSLVLLVQTVLMFIGMSEDGEGAVDMDGGEGDIDISETETDIDVGEAADGMAGLRVFTLRGIVAFFVVFGWVGVVMDSCDAALWLTIPVSIISGGATMVLLAYLFKALMNLRSDGNIDNRNAVGTSCKVHLTVPPNRTGEGKVHIMLQGAYVERMAVTDEAEAIPTGAEAVVVSISGETDLVIRRK